MFGVGNVGLFMVARWGCRVLPASILCEDVCVSCS